MTSMLERRRTELRELCRHFRVRRLAVFGSAVRNDFDPERSDLDFIVDFEPLPAGEYARTYFGLLQGLGKLFGRPVDLLEYTSLRNPYLRKEIEATQEILHGS